MHWHACIDSAADIPAGKPVIRGARIAVDFLLNLLASGWPHGEVLRSYPALTQEALRCVPPFAAEATRGVSVYSVPLRTG